MLALAVVVVVSTADTNEGWRFVRTSQAAERGGTATLHENTGRLKLLSAAAAASTRTASVEQQITGSRFVRTGGAPKANASPRYNMVRKLMLSSGEDVGDLPGWRFVRTSTADSDTESNHGISPTGRQLVEKSLSVSPLFQGVYEYLLGTFFSRSEGLPTEEHVTQEIHAVKDFVSVFSKDYEQPASDVSYAGFAPIFPPDYSAPLTDTNGGEKFMPTFVDSTIDHKEGDVSDPSNGVFY
jgi:hypothetical protein